MGYRPGSILLTDNQRTDSSLSVLIHPYATLAADYNGNGVVDAADYVVWRNTLGQSGAGLVADGNASGTIDLGDYGVWRAHFGQTAGSGAGVIANATVPEPASAALVACGLLVVLLWPVSRPCPPA